MCSVVGPTKFCCASVLNCVLAPMVSGCGVGAGGVVVHARGYAGAQVGRKEQADEPYIFVHVSGALRRSDRLILLDVLSAAASGKGARPPAGWPTGCVRYALARRTGRSILRTDAPEEELAREVGDRDRVVVREGEASIRAARALFIPLTLSTRRPLQQQHRTFGALCWVLTGTHGDYWCQRVPRGPRSALTQAHGTVGVGPTAERAKPSLVRDCSVAANPTY